jgi:predicted ATP-grasp superfamily ATP-dependent carboligase
VDRACALAHVVAEEFGVVGVNGIDFVARDGLPFAIEVNPRWTASMELAERAYGLSVFVAHAAACAAGALPHFDLVRARRGAGAVGKAVVFARRDVTVGDTRAWLPPGNNVDDVDNVDAVDAAATVRDIPHPGERIAAGRPVCTVFAAGRDGAACHAALVRRAERVYAELVAWEREVA